MARQFYTIDTYGSHAHDYTLLPFKFMRIDGKELLVNEAGDYLWAESGTVKALASHSLPTHTNFYQTLKAQHFLFDRESAPLLDVLATKYRTKKAFLEQFVTLHIMVLTLRCEHTCQYCQVSRQTADRTAFDMTEATAYRSLDLIFRAPAQHLTLEFQVGEPLLAFDLLQSVVRRAKELSASSGKTLTLVVATNLAVSTDEMLRYFRDEEIHVSTSLDGPAFLHNRNRPRPGNNSHELAVQNIKRAQATLGPDRVAALMTTTQASLPYPREIVDEYVKHGLRSIFVRPISPYGFATKMRQRTGYGDESFLDFYKEALSYIVELNRSGTLLTEIYARLLLTKILTPFGTGYVDLQSPAGAGTSVLVYNYDGDIYASDESRMLAEMKDHTFRLGNVHRDDYASLIQSTGFQYLSSASCNETLPGCSDCAFQSYCGADPIFHHTAQGDAFGHRPTSEFCARNMAILQHLFRLLRVGGEALHR